MRDGPIGRGRLLRLAVPVLLLCLNACAMVGVSWLKPGDVMSEQRTDVIGNRQFSDGTTQVLSAKQCAQSFGTCNEIVEHASGLDAERGCPGCGWRGRCTATAARPWTTPRWTQTALAGWTVLRPDADLRLHAMPGELISASTLRFKGLRNV